MNNNNEQSSLSYLPICSSPDKRHLSIDINSTMIHTPVTTTGIKKSERKKLEKLSKFNFDQQALFSAVENEHFDRTRMIIETTNVDVNSTNSDGFTTLDIATMLLNLPLIKYLQSCTAREVGNRHSRERHLQSLLSEAERCVYDLTACYHRQSIQPTITGGGPLLPPQPLSSATITGTGNLSSALVKEKERQIMFWQRRLKLLQRLKKGFDLLQPPPPPLSVHVQVAGAECLLVNYYPPIRLQQDHRRQIITKYKIEWSSNQFETIIGCVEMTNMCAKHEFLIERLESEQCYQVRIASGNCKGYSEYCYPLMNQSVPSTWRSIDKKHSKIEDRVPRIDQLFDQIVEWRQQQQQRQQQRDYVDKRKSIELDQTSSSSSLNVGSGMIGGISTSSTGSSGGILGGNLAAATTTMTTTNTVSNSLGVATSGSQKKVRKSIRNFFGSTSKFQKTMKRGAIYLASLVYNGTDKRVLVTNEEVLPIIEIDDSYPSTLQNDFYWLLKITCCTWDDVKMFRKELEKSQQSSTVAQFRTKILLAIEQMQNSLGIVDLGKIYYKPLRDTEGSVVLCAIRSVPEPKMISCLSVRWLPLAKLQKRIATTTTNMFTSERVSDSGISVTDIGSPPPRLVGDILFATIDEMMQYHQACNSQLDKGLYIAYVKLKSSVDMMSVVVGRSHPNILPFAKIRDNPHVSRQEWAALKMCLKPRSNNHQHHHDNNDDQITGTLDEKDSAGDDVQTWKRLVTSVSQLHLQLVNSNHNHQQQQSESKETISRKSKESHIGGAGTSCSPNFLAAPNTASSDTISTTTPLSSPMTQTGPGFVDNFFQLACQHQNEQQKQSQETMVNEEKFIKTREEQQQQPSEEEECMKNVRIEKPNTLPVNRLVTTMKSNQQSSIIKPQRLTFGQKMNFQQLTKFLQILSHTAAHFLQSIGVAEDQHLQSHRIYTVEIIELDGNVSLILLLPPPDEVCSVTQSDVDINSRCDDLLFLPLKIFELIHMNTYQRRFTGQYWRLSALLELDIIAAQQAQREAFSKSEVSEARARLNQLLEFQTQLDEHCRSMRWIMDVVAYARDRQISAGITLIQIQHCLSSINKQMWDDDSDDDHIINDHDHRDNRRYNFGQSTNNRSSNINNNSNTITSGDGMANTKLDFVTPKINIQSECNSTPSSPPAAIIPPLSMMAAMGRRKSRDDSYVEQHHRQQNHFNSLAHQRFHHNYHGCQNGKHHDDHDHVVVDDPYDDDPTLDVVVTIDGQPLQQSPNDDDDDNDDCKTPTNHHNHNQQHRSSSLQPSYSSSNQRSIMDDKCCSDYSESGNNSPGLTVIDEAKINVRRCHSASRLPSLSSTTAVIPVITTGMDEQIDGRQSIDSGSTSLYSSQPSTTTNVSELPTLAILVNSNNNNKENESPTIIIAEPTDVTIKINDNDDDDDDNGKKETEQQDKLNSEQIWLPNRSEIIKAESLDNHCFNDNFEDILSDSQNPNGTKQESKMEKSSSTLMKIAASTTKVIRHQIPKRKIRSKKMRTLMELGSNKMVIARYSNQQSHGCGKENSSSSNNSNHNNRTRRRRKQWKHPCCSKCCRRLRRKHNHRKRREKHGPHPDNYCDSKINSCEYSHSSSSLSLSSSSSYSINSNSESEPNTHVAVDFQPIGSNDSSSSSSKGMVRIVQIYVEQESCLPQGTLLDVQIASGDQVFNVIQAIIAYSITFEQQQQQQQQRRRPTTTSMKLSDYRFEWQNYSLLAIYSSNVKHLNYDFHIDQLQSPWDDLDAKLCLHFNLKSHHHHQMK
nr:uncharacterized protein LOC124489782 isoform X2 [Dermatophagoides farinae]